MDRLERQRHRDGLFEQRDHVGVLLDHAVQREMLGRILHDEEGVAGIRHVIVPALADRDALIEPVAAVERLAQLEQIALAGEPDAELLAHRARAAVAAGKIARGDLGHAAGAAELCRDGIRMLGELEKFRAVAHRHRRQRLRDRLQQRLQRVL